MHDETVNPADERVFAGFLDRLVAGEPGVAGVDPALAETARDLQDRAARSTVSAPPAGALATIRAGLFDAPVASRRHRAALGIVPNALLVTRPAAQIALAAAILLAVLTGFAAYRSGAGWLGHIPTSTHSALAASATAPFTAQLAMSPDNGSNTIRTGFIVPDTTTCTVAPRTVEQIQTIDANKSGSETSQPLPMSTTRAGAVGGSGSTNLAGSNPASIPTPTPVYLSELPAGTPADAATVKAISATVGEIYGCLKADKRLQAYALFTDAGLARYSVPSLLFSQGILEGPGDRTAFRIAGADVLPDGRVVAKIAFQVSEGIYNEMWIFAPSGDHYLVDEMNPMQTPPTTTPLAVTHVSLPSTPIASPTTAMLSPDVQSLLASCPMPPPAAIPGVDMTHLAWAVGQTPFWIVGTFPSSGTSSQGRLPYASFLTNKTTLFSYTSPDLQAPVTFSLHRTDGAQRSPMSDNGQIRFDPTFLQSTSSQFRVRPSVAQMWATATTLPGTGCYELSVQWTGGKWTIRFPVVIAHPSAPPHATPVSATPVASPVSATPSARQTSASATCPMPDAKAVDVPIMSGGQLIHAWGLGESPLWLVGLGKTPSWYHPTDPGFVVSGSNLPSGAVTRPGARIDVLWLMDPKHPQPVNIRGKSLEGGADLFFQTSDTPGDTKEASFTPGGTPGTAYMWWTTIIATQPGCYEITATWASGSWTIRIPLPEPANAIASPSACATPGATPTFPGSPVNPVQSLMQPPPFATRQPPIPFITPGVQQIITPPGLPLITPTPFATIIVPAKPSPACSG